ncbi:MAG: hypothetical protein ABI414_05890 [Devosia sp.]
MTKTISLTLSLAIAVLGFAAAVAPAQAATRLMNSSLEGFEFRCEAHGGIFGQDDDLVMCQTPTVPVACQFTAVRQAVCEWPGIENQIAVIRVIGTLPISVYGSAGGNGGGANAGNKGGGGGLQGPNGFAPAPQNDPKPNFNGPKDFQMAP